MAGVRVLLVTGLLLLLTAGATGLFASGAFDPERLAESSDVVVRGTVTAVEPSGGLPTDRYDVNHPVTLRVTDVFKGEAGDSITIQVGGSEQTYISTASFTEGEDVVVMLQEQDANAHPHIDTLYYLTAGHPGKFTVTDGTVQVDEPEQKRVTVDYLKDIVQRTDTADVSGSPERDVEDNTPDESAHPTGAVTGEPTDVAAVFAQLWNTVSMFF